ncbi:sigma-54 dependent transcriptional regulator [Methylotenera sp.]|uniref:sigma-54-dependent transcriptional regulator n=1 Tax=Methylotenera sp. TaxID=2051956 RepID=UPI00271C4451|nr:sigma-54 dependent transcriptional regulator [Methylotenera sp.]MDO9205505.1 sigma-54 dependent transcriptional regulator [Methylotenera sp.]MDP1522319.1 sigma-54 dependent transcriptional regulator [Methylotenera sp.]MDP3307786.1 sigma-54 dependent transcriptional regulator [Methylotenera sp.]MDP3818548.1 sigma-54 dependent transcriptional regulator [Methylotenera sp.]
MNQQKRILAVDDEPHMRRLLEISLRQAGYQPIVAENGQEALRILRDDNVDLVVSDLHMPVMDGLKLLEAMRTENIEIPIIIVTAQGEIASAVQAMKLGASDYILRPFDLETLEIGISRALSITRLKLENQFLRDEANQSGKSLTSKGLIGESPGICKVHHAISQVAAEKVTVMITGETGTGKELVARAIHQQSPRKNSLFVAVNCAAIPSEMLESELFGHERGAFTGAVKERVGKFELADGGTLFLDEITEMPISLQAKLLRALQEGTIERLGSNRPLSVDIRVLAATNRDPMHAIKEGKLREDLYYRLNVFRIDLPPLRDRLSDIEILASHFLKKRNISIDDNAIRMLQSYSWPGNVRELENVLERAAIVCGGHTIHVQHLPADIHSNNDIHHSLKSKMPEAAQHTASLSLPDAVQSLEMQMITEALNQANDNKSRAAKLLNISERTLWYKLSRYNLTNH